MWCGRIEAPVRVRSSAASSVRAWPAGHTAAEIWEPDPVPEPTSKKKQRPARTERAAMPSGVNPRWLAPAMITLFIVALVYLVVAYLFSMQWPLPIGNWNLVVGFSFAIAGFALATRWK